MTEPQDNDRLDVIIVYLRKLLGAALALMSLALFWAAVAIGQREAWILIALALGVGGAGAGLAAFFYLATGHGPERPPPAE
jgi:hypothetical protein